MKTADREIKDQAEAFVPEMTESYKEMIMDTVSELRARTAVRHEPKRRVWRPLAAAAAAFAVLLGVSAAVFAARPALAAEVPGVSSIVYAAAQQKAASEADRQRIDSLITEAFRALAVCDYDSARSCFREGKLNAQENYFAAAYLNYLLATEESTVQSADAGELEITELTAEQKAFRYTACVMLKLVSKEGKVTTEECTATVWENTDGMRIERIVFDSEDYKAYAALYRNTFGSVPPRYADMELIPIDNSILRYANGLSASEGPRLVMNRWNRLIMQIDYVSASDEEKAERSRIIELELNKAEVSITQEEISSEELAAELMYRYWLGRKTGEAGDFEDIMEHNEQTDLFLWDALLEAETVKLGVLKPLETVEKDDSPMVTEVLEETDDILKARIYVYTDISDGVSRGVGEEIVLTLRKGSGGYTVIGFDREVGDGRYLSLKTLAEGYKAEGYPWQEAGRMAYGEMHSRLERDAEALAGY